MAKRPIEAKKRRKVIKALRTTPPAKIDLIHYIKLRTRCTTGMARKVILAGALRVDDEPIGIARVLTPAGKHIDVVQRYVPAELREKIVIVDPDTVKA
jgi:hypothetical protein